MALKHTTQKDGTVKISRGGVAKGRTRGLIATPVAVGAQVDKAMSMSVEDIYRMAGIQH